MRHVAGTRATDPHHWPTSSVILSKRAKLRARIAPRCPGTIARAARQTHGPRQHGTPHPTDDQKAGTSPGQNLSAGLHPRPNPLQEENQLHPVPDAPTGFRGPAERKRAKPCQAGQQRICNPQRPHTIISGGHSHRHRKGRLQETEQSRHTPPSRRIHSQPSTAAGRPRLGRVVDNNNPGSKLLLSGQPRDESYGAPHPALLRSFGFSYAFVHVGVDPLSTSEDAVPERVV